MKPYKIIAICSAVVCLSGCGPKESESVDVPPPSTTPPVTMTPAAPPTPAPTPDTPPPVAGAIMPTAESTEVKVVDVEGKPLPILDFMNQAVEFYERTRSGMTEGTPWPPLTDLNQLVQYGALKRLPAAPDGQKFHLNPETKKVTVVPK
jgi:hypothetical protein